jgi:D-methionine transport system substrate-binding protein
VIVTESRESEIALKNANIIACRKNTENTSAIKLLIEALKQENIRDYIQEQFGNSVIPMF